MRKHLKQADRVFRQHEPIPDVPDKDSKITIPPGAYWQNEDTLPLLLLGCLYLEICRIPEAEEELDSCFEEWDKTLGNKLRKLMRIGRESHNPSIKVQSQLNPIVDNMVDQCGFNSIDVATELEAVLGPWTRKWTCGSSAMASFIHFRRTFKIGPEEQIKHLSREHSRALKATIRTAAKPDNVFRQYMEHLASQAAGEQYKHWAVLMSPEWERCERVARKEARGSVRDNGFSLKYEETLLRQVWCFVQLEVLGKTIHQLFVDAKEKGVQLPSATFYDAKELSDYMKPLYEALSLDGPIIKRYKYRLRDEIDYIQQDEEEKSQEIDSIVR